MTTAVRPTTFGLALACFFAFTAIGSPFSTLLVEKLGAARQLALSSIGAGVAMTGLGHAASAGALAGFLSAAGFTNSLVQPAVGRVLSSEVAPKHLSLASGLIQAALGGAPLLAGLLTRFLAAPYGWRAALWIGGLLVILSLSTSLLAGRRKSIERIYRQTPSSETPSLRSVARWVLFAWTLGAALGSVAVNVTASFFVPIGVDSGFSTEAAGLLLSAASALAIVMRVTLGALGDLRPRSNPSIVASMMLMGSLGLIIISWGTPTTFVVGILLVVAGAWTWNGLLVASAIRLLPGTAARATGTLQVGFFSGATTAPLAFSALSTTLGVGNSLMIVAAVSLIGAGVVLVGTLLLRRMDVQRVCS